MIALALSFLLDLSVKQFYQTTVEIKEYEKRFEFPIDFRKKIEGLLPKKGVWGIFIKDLNTGSVFSINENLSFPAASLYKVIVVLALYQKAEEKEVDLKQIVELKSQEVVDENSIKPGFYTLEKLAELSLKHSDNNAPNALIRFLGFKEVEKFKNELGLIHTDLRKNFTTPFDMGILFSKIRDYPQLIDFLTKTAFEDRIPFYLPEEIKVAHKIGTLNGVYHDAGIIFGKTPFILIILSKGSEKEKAIESIRNISKYVFEYLNEESKTN